MEQKLMSLPAEETFLSAEALWPVPEAREIIRRRFEEEYRSFAAVVMALDDDPTGVQTVHDIHVLTSWEEETLAEQFRSGERLFFLLTNSRSLSAGDTVALHREIAEHAGRAASAAGRPLVVISRGDSTLRGHYPLETDTLRAALEAQGQPPFAGEWLCPFFREGGRFTLNGIHYVREGEQLVPTAQTEFARDRTFGYHHSRLAEYIVEKSGGRVQADQVVEVSLKALRSLAWEETERQLESAPGFRYLVSDALEETDVMAMATILLRLMKKGRSFMIRSAAAVPKVLGHVSSRPLLSREEMVDPDAAVGGLVIVGSHVRKTTAQLDVLRRSDRPMAFIEFHTEPWHPAALQAETARVTALAEQVMREGSTAVVYTSRRLVSPEGASPEELLAISVRISAALTAVVSSLSFRPRFLIAKGGITSSDVGVKALRVQKALVLGQAAPGIPVWRTGPESLFPGLSYIIFPGNVGGEDTLRSIVETLT